MKMKRLWEKYIKTRNRDTKNQLIEGYIDIVKIVAGRMYNFYGSRIEYDDLIGFGTMGLIDSIERFDLDRGAKFETYAQIRIRGTIIDNIRKLDWVPRSLRKRSRDIQSAMLDLENKLGRSPSNDELSQFLNISLTDLEATLADITNFNVVSLEELLTDSGEYNIANDQDSIIPEQAFEMKELKQFLVSAINTLGKQKRTVISLYYYEELTYKEIGYIMELSESRISQIHSKAILKIKNQLLEEFTCKY